MADENREQNLVAALLQAASYMSGEDSQRKITIRRGGKPLFSFTVTALDENTWDKARRQNIKNRGKRSEELDAGRFLAQVIFEATDPEDQKLIWKNREVWNQLNVATGVDAVNLILTPAEKAKVAEIIEELSGYTNDEISIEDEMRE